LKHGILVTTLVVALCSVSGSGTVASAQATGTISGQVTVVTPRRRTANRYPGGSQAAHETQTPAAVVYLKGRIDGPTPAGSVRNPDMLQRDTAFVPSTVAVTVGGTVSFPNGDPFFHNVFSFSATKRFDLGRYPEGETKEVVFDKPGTVEVFCEVHDFMRGTIVVTENPYHAVVAADGSFSIQGIPAGTHTLVAWHPDRDAVEREVTVTAGGDVRIEVELR